MEEQGFLPVTAEEVRALGREVPDFVYVFGDAYVDHPSFGPAIISRVLEKAGFVVAMLPQPDWHSTADFLKFGRPRLGFLVSAGNIDSMVAHYTAAKKRRGEDFYSPNCQAGLRPDRATITYCNRVREAFGDIPIIIGGLEASLRRFAHYDYWDDKVRRSILLDSRADLLSYGMGEKSILRIAQLLDKGVPIGKIRDVRGTAYLCRRGEKLHYPAAQGEDETGEPVGYDFETLRADKAAYAAAFAVQYRANDAVTGKAVVEYYDNRMLVVNPPMPPLERAELDAVYALPYTRNYHPMYEPMGGVPAIQEVKFSITHNRGCFGGCAFCAIAYHQGRAVRSRSIESCVREAEILAAQPDFKGYIHDVGGPTANFRAPACEKQLTAGVCSHRRCLAPTPCPNLKADHTEYIELLRAIENVAGVKKVFIRSGIRFDYVLADKSDAFLRKLVADHVSGQLKVAPEHISPNVLAHMGKPPRAVYDTFCEKYRALSARAGKEQYLVPYLMSSHPGSTVGDALELALYMKKIRLNPEQVQDFYPTPGTASTVMYYTGIDPFTGKAVYVAKTPEEKRLQRALLQYQRPENRKLILSALAGTEYGEKAKELYGGSVRGDAHGKAEGKAQTRGDGHAAHGDGRARGSGRPQTRKDGTHRANPHGNEHGKKDKKLVQ